MKIKSLRNSTRRGGLCFALLVLMAIITPLEVYAQDQIVTIAPGGGNAVTYPVNFTWPYNENQMILTADEIGTAGSIVSLAYKRYSGGNGDPTTRTFDIYMMHTTRDSYESTNDWIPVTANDLVFSSSYTFQTTGDDWQTIELDTPFEYNGSDNLCICIDDNTGNTSTAQYWSTHNCPVNRGVRAWSSNNFDPTVAPTSGSVGVYVADIQIGITSSPTPRPNNLTASNVTAHEATLTWNAQQNATPTGYQYQYKAGEGEWTALESTTGTSVNLTGLLSDTDYTFQVKAIYAEGESSFASTTFHTEISCPAPTALQALLTPLNATIATLSWTENGTATNWVLEYGLTADFTGATSVNVSGTPSHNLTGLTPETPYYARVKADCGGGDQSQWSAVLSFTPTEFVTIGESTTANYTLPVNMNYHYSLTEQIYTADEIGITGTINSISFYYNYSGSFSMSNVTLYMKNVTRSEFVSNTDMEQLSDNDIVWNGTFSASAAGWITITLPEPFDYEGGNLLVAAYDGTSGYPGSSYRFRTTACTGYKSIDWYSDSYSPDPYNTSSYSGNKYYRQYRNNIKLHITPSTTPKPKSLTASNVTAHEATLSWTAPNANVTSYQYQYMPSGGQWTSLVTTTDLSVSLSGLLSDTDYTFRVKALYAEGESYFASRTFHTEISCPMPTNLQASFALIDPTTATVSWTENGTATNWVVEYGTAADFTGANTLNASDTPSKVLSGLTPETKYYVRVKADCGEGDQSLWSNVVEFMPTAYIIFGNEATTSSTAYLPINTGYNYSVTQQIYSAAEVAAAGGVEGTITSIAFYYKGYSSASSMEGIQIYMKNTSKSSFTSNYDYVPVGLDDKVFEGTLPLPVESGWVTIDLDEEFNYDGTSSILVCIYDPIYGYPGNGYQFYYTSTPNSSALELRGTSICPDLNNLSSYSASRYTYRTNTRFLPTYVPRPQHLTASSITAYAATLSWSAANNEVSEYQYQYKVGEGEWTALESTTGTTFSLTLVPETEYTFRVKALYGENESDFSTLSFTALATCPKPTDLQCTLDRTNATVATLNWLQGYEEENWVLQIGTNSEFAPDTYTELTTGFTVASTTITANLTDLTPGTKYYARVKADCGGGDQSYWSNVVEFMPTLQITVYDGTHTSEYIPLYASKFGMATKSECIINANLLTNMDECQITSITFYPSSVADITWGNAGQQVFLREVDAPFFDYITTWNDTTQVFQGHLSSPAPGDNTYTITFNRPYTYHGGYLLIGVYNIQTGSNNSIYWYGIQNNSIQGASRYGWAGSIGWVSFSPSNFLPKTTFDYIPNPIARPRNLTASNIAIHSATLSWTAANENVTGYLYQYKLTGDEWPTDWSSTTALSVDLEGLTAETEYTFRVKALYGEVESNEVSITFIPTPTMTLPLYETTTNATSDIPIYSRYYNYYAKNECLFPATQLAGMNGATLSSITFYAKTIYSGTLDGTTQVFVKEVDHAILNEYEGTEGATIVFEGQLPEPTYSLDGYTIPFTQDFTYHGGNLLIGIYNTTPSNSSKQVDWYGVYTSQNTSAKGYSSNSLESVGCSTSSWLPRTTFTFIFKNPWGLKASNYTMDGATLSWNAPRIDYLRCEYQYRAEGSEEWSDLESTNETSVALTGLTTETNYVFRVRAVYEGEIVGDFVSFVFQLPVFIDATHPYADGFENGNPWLFFNGTETNQWVIGTATSLDGTKSLYISNDEGQTHAYSTTMSHVFATKTFHLAAGNYEVGYNWKNYGCSQDLFRVVLAPASKTFLAGENTLTYIESSECIALDYGQSYYLSSWQTRTVQIEVPEEGDYKVVFYWYNFNASVYGIPAAIDNFYIKVYYGEAPDNLMASNITAHTANLSWDENGTAEAWQVKYFTDAEYQASGQNPDNENYGHLVNAETHTNFTLSGLDPETDYVCYVRSCYSVNGQTGYTDWCSNPCYFETLVSCFPVTNLHVAELGATTATLAWNTDPSQGPENAPAEWNVVYIKAPAITYTFEDENSIPEYDFDNETDWSVVNTVTAHNGDYCLISNNNAETYLYIPAYGGATASFWAKSLVENEMTIIVRFNGDWIGSYNVTSQTYQKIAVDLADYQNNGTLILEVDNQVAIDDITINVPTAFVTHQNFTFDQGSIDDYVEFSEGWSLVIDGENGYIMSEAGYTGDEGAIVVFPIQLGGHVLFSAKTLANEDQTYLAYISSEQSNNPIQFSLQVSSEFDDYDWDMSAYSGTGYLIFIANDQPSLAIDNLSFDQASMYSIITANNNTIELNVDPLAVYTVGVQAHCGEGDDSGFANPVTFVPALCESENQCVATYEWTTVGSSNIDYAIMKIVHHDTGLRVGFVEMDFGSSGSGSFMLCNNEVYDVYYEAYGKSEGYIDFTIYDAAGDVIVDYAQFQTLPVGQEYLQFTANCDICQMPQNLTASVLSTQSAQLDWQQGGYVTSWLVSYRDTNALGDAVTYSNWNALPEGWLPLEYEEGSLVAGSDWAPESGTLVSDNGGSYLFVPVTMGGQAVVTVRGGGNDGFGIGVYQGNSPVGMSESDLPELNMYYNLSENAQSFAVDLSGYEGDGYLVIYHFIMKNSLAGLYLDQLVVYGPPTWPAGVIVTDTPSYTLEGLTPGHTYQARVQAICGDNEYGNPVMVTFYVPLCSPESQCEISYELHDSYGDGWNGNTLNIIAQSSGSVVASITLTDGSSSTGTLGLCNGEVFDFEWVYGEYPDECSFTILDPSGNTILSMNSLTNLSNLTLLSGYEMNCDLPVTTQLVAGWNWWAPTMEISAEDLEDAIGEYQVMTEDNEPVSAFVPGEMYRIFVNDSHEFTLNGTPVSSVVEIEIEEGTNWFGFIGDEPADIEDVFADFEPVAGDKVISQEGGFAIYTVTEGVGSWVGTLTTLVPGKGYVYVSQDEDAKTLYLGGQ
jgi:chitodextrinase